MPNDARKLHTGNEQEVHGQQDEVESDDEQQLAQAAPDSDLPDAFVSV